MAGEVVRWDPFREALSLHDAMDRLFEDSFILPRGAISRDTLNSGNLMPLDMYETPEELIVHAALPGIKSEDVDIQFQDGRLILDATIPAPKIENATFHYRELGYGKCHREIALPFEVDTNKVEATIENGLLTLRLPKAEKVKPKKIQVKAVAK